MALRHVKKSLFTFLVKSHAEVCNFTKKVNTLQEFLKDFNFSLKEHLFLGTHLSGFYDRN